MPLLVMWKLRVIGNCTRHQLLEAAVISYQLLVSMHGLQTFAFLKAGKVNQRIDSPCAPVSRMIKEDITEPIFSLASITGQLNVMNVMAGCPMSFIPRFLAASFFMCEKGKK